MSLLLCQVPYEIVGRRSGDTDTVYADPALALRELNWKANKGLKEMCKQLFVCSISSLYWVILSLRLN